MKKILSFIFGLLGFCAIVVCVTLAIKMPNIYTDLIGITDTSTSSVVSDVPYFIDFKRIGNDSFEYKSRTFSMLKDNGESDGYKWFSTWGRTGGINADGEVPTGYLLGWNDKSKVQTTSYMATQSILSCFTQEELQGMTYSYCVMDFDFTRNHYCKFTFNAYDSLTDDTSAKLCFIKSNDFGVSWSVLGEKAPSDLREKIPNYFENTIDELHPTRTRYGLVLLSSKESARIELEQFHVINVSLA